MQHMQDKEFDQLFKDRFEEAEVQPSSNLWDTISAELESKPKGGLQIYWMAAAVAVMVVGIGLLMPKTEKIRLQAPVEIADIKAEDVSKPSANVVIDDTESDQSYQSTPLVIAPRLKPEGQKKTIIIMQPKVVDEHLVNKPADVKEHTPVMVKPPVPTDMPIVIASANTADQNRENEIAETERPERKGIRNVGDLVNYVVDKVDKRENKILKFNTDEDDNSSLIAINIGFIRLNSKKHK
ncbi:hypothetical protein [Pedobacter frigoris]|uniref:Uncharacterized protein n=1 Tax=Pedobacter frigoris TaxID=2571272 RepID=A0A4U1CMW0_9SPHI|nr:hypothetical protein [Pedobacter frigoris]TKC08556.1 hypothetical protein FA047_00185 [Pedobacter frigoris]